ncbi:MAG: hypothetical protein HC914_05755 [Chloroflexaceae bacterium]|nr:hypothetical protein [Chloroflexaceae bacterium]
MTSQLVLGAALCVLMFAVVLGSSAGAFAQSDESHPLMSLLVVLVVGLLVSGLGGCGNPFGPVEPAFVTRGPTRPPLTTQQQLAEVAQDDICKYWREGCVLIEVVAMPGNIPLNRVPAGVRSNTGSVGSTNEQGWVMPYPVRGGEYEVSMGMIDRDGAEYTDRKLTTVRNGQVTFVRFEVPLEHVHPRYLPGGRAHPNGAVREKDIGGGE